MATARELALPGGRRHPFLWIWIGHENLSVSRETVPRAARRVVGTEAAFVQGAPAGLRLLRRGADNWLRMMMLGRYTRQFLKRRRLRRSGGCI